MAKNQESINRSLFELLRSRGYAPTLLDTSGKEIPVPEEAEEIVHCAPLGYIWPVDPYMFSLSGACYPKQKSDRWFYPSLITAGSESARFKPL